MILLSPVYALLQYTKLLASFERVHDFFISKFKIADNIKFITLENCFKVQVFVEFFFETLPQLIIQSTNNNMTEWSSVANFSFAMTILLFMKDATILTLYLIRRFIDGASNPELRPKATG